LTNDTSADDADTHAHEIVWWGNKRFDPARRRPGTENSGPEYGRGSARSVPGWALSGGDKKLSPTT
jgi:hypothetical protein